MNDLIKSKEIKLVKISEIKLNPKNRNKHPKEQIERLKEIIEYNGFRRPVSISNRTGQLVCGEGRYLAAKAIGLKEIPAIFQDYDTPEQEFADSIADNAIDKWAELDHSGIITDAMEFDDFNFDMMGIEDFQLPTVIDPEKEAIEDEIPEDVEIRVKPGDLWQLGEHRLLCGDATNIQHVERLMGSDKADMLFTDPPYGDNHAAMDIEHKNGKIKINSKKIKNDTNLDFLAPSMNCAFTVLKESSTKMIFFKWKKWIEVLNSCEHFGDPSAVIVWDRDEIGGAIMRFNPCHEFCFHFGSQTDKRSKSNLKNVWREKKERENKILHPTVKPIEIIAPAIEVCTDKNNNVLDLFGGSGSTLIACEKTKRKCFMMELDCYYVSVIIEMWQKYSGKDAYLLKDDGSKVKYAELPSM